MGCITFLSECEGNGGNVMSEMVYTQEDILEDVARAAGCAVCEMENFKHQYVAEDGGVWSLLHPAWKPIYRRTPRQVKARNGMVPLEDRRGVRWMVAVELLVERCFGVVA